MAGPRQANKSAGLTQFVGHVCLDAIADDLLYEPTAHAVDVPVEIHGGGKQYALRGVRRGSLTIYFVSCTDGSFARR